jgi:cystathionine beta-lyase/cystathionine gamma-synthase
MERFDDITNDQEICMHYNTDTNPFYGSIIPPIFENALFTFPSHEKFIEAETNQEDHYVYWRGTNPTVKIVEKKLADLERGEECKCFASGMAAITAAIFSSVQAGDHVLCISNIYKSTMELLSYLEKFNVSSSTIYSTNKEEIRTAILPNTRLIFIENPTSMNHEIVDLEQISQLAKELGIRTIIDNTWATPLFQKPLLFGIDMVVHSASKYLGGHGDIVGGALITSKQLMKKIFKKEYLLFGGSMGPHEAALLLRGLQTLPLRMKIHQENTLAVAKFLDSHEAVKKVNYPGLPIHQDNPLIQKQLTGFSGLLTFELINGTFENVKKVINKVKVFKIGVSWGSFESLILSLNFGNNEKQLVEEEHISPGLIRLSIGMEPVDKLISDLEQALS